MHKRIIGEGTCGTCYELSDGSVLKLFKYPKDKDELDRYTYFLNYKNDSILFPYKFKTTKRYLKGYITEKAPGEIIESSLKLYNLNKIIDNTIKLEKDIMFVSQGKIVMYDVHSENIFYDGNKFSIIDTDEYSISHTSADEVFYRNIKMLKRTFLEVIYQEICKTSKKNVEDIFNELRLYSVYDYEINQMLTESKNILEYYYNKKIIKLEDIGENDEKQGNMYIRSNRSR